jgi:hypothetical protein
MNTDQINSHALTLGKSAGSVLATIAINHAVQHGFFTSAEAAMATPALTDFAGAAVGAGCVFLCAFFSHLNHSTK